MANKSYDSLLHHLGGVGAILRSRSRESAFSYKSKNTLYEYRSIHLPIALTNQKPNFRGQPERIDPPWKSSVPYSATYLQTILDIGFRVPILMERLDRTRSWIYHSILESKTNDRVTNNLILDSLDIRLDLDHWERRLRSGNISQNSTSHASHAQSTLPKSTI